MKSGAPPVSKGEKVDTKAIPPTEAIKKGYEAERDNLMRILHERMKDGDRLGADWAKHALESLERQHQRAVQMGTFRDHLDAFRRAQPGGWG